MNLNTFKKKISKLKDDDLIQDYEFVLRTGKTIDNPVDVSLLVRKGMRVKVWKNVKETATVYKEIKAL